MPNTNYYAHPNGSNTAPYDTWAKAATSLKTVTDLAIEAGDRVFAPSTWTQAIAGTIYTVHNTAQIISTSDTVNMPPQTYAAGCTMDASASSGADLVIRGGHWFGFNFKAGTGTGICEINLNDLSGCAGTFENCEFWTGGTSSTTRINVGNQSVSAGRMYTRTVNCKFYWAHNQHAFAAHNHWEDEGSDMCAGATVPLTLIKVATGKIRWQGSDVSDIAGTLVGGSQPSVSQVELWACKINAACTFLAAATQPTAEVYLFDCSDGDTHYGLAHYNYLGQTTVTTTGPIMNTADKAVYDGTNAHSWVVTGVNATFAHPYQSPWLDVYTESLTQITPYFEILRNDSVDPYTNGQVWAEWMVKTTSGTTLASLYSDRRLPLASAAAQADGAGLAAWDNEGTAKSMKVDSGSPVTPAEIGHIRGRICVADAITVYVNPKPLGV